MFELNLNELIPKGLRDAKALLAWLPVEVFLGENPLSSTLLLPGTADRTRKRLSTLKYPDDNRAVHRAEQLYDAWLAFYRGNISEAQEGAVKLFEEIGNNETWITSSAGNSESPAYLQKLGAAYLICCLARYGMASYRTDAAVSYMMRLKECPLRCAQAAAIDLAMYEMSIGIMSDIPAWIKEGEYGVGRVGDRLLFSDDGVYPENIYGAVLATVQYRNYRGEYMKSLSLIDTAEKVYGMKSVIIGDIYFAIFRALNCEALGFPEDTKANLKQAVKLIRKDALWQIISQFESFFGDKLTPIIKEADPKGQKKYLELSEGFFDRVKQTHLEERDRRGYKKLSPQELEVMRLVAAGHKNKDIAETLHIETVTVKFHRQNARNKLGLSSRAGLSEIREALERHETRAEWI